MNLVFGGMLRLIFCVMVIAFLGACGMGNTVNPACHKRAQNQAAFLKGKIEKSMDRAAIRAIETVNECEEGSEGAYLLVALRKGVSVDDAVAGVAADPAWRKPKLSDIPEGEPEDLEDTLFMQESKGGVIFIYQLNKRELMVEFVANQGN